MSLKKQAEEIFNRHLSEYDVESYTEADEDIKQCHLNAIIEALNTCQVKCTNNMTNKYKL